MDDPMGEDGEDVPGLSYRTYVVSSVTVPTTSAEAKADGLDLNSDGVIDNQLGDVIATLSTMGVDANASVKMAIDRGESILLARIGTTSFTDAATATLQTYAGSDPSTAPCSGTSDTVCRKHLDGSTTFTATALSGTPLEGKFVGGTFTGSSGDLVVRIALLGSAPVDLVLQGSRARLTMTSDSQIGDAQLAGAVSMADVDSKVLPAVQANMMASVTADCTTTTVPYCGCATNSDGKMVISTFDKSPADCKVSLDELRNNALVKALLAPDVMINGSPAISVGVSATAVSASFTAP